METVVNIPGGGPATEPPEDGADGGIASCTSAAADYFPDPFGDAPPVKRERPRWEYFEEPSHDDEPPDPAPQDGGEPPQRPWRTGLLAEATNTAPEDNDGGT